MRNDDFRDALARLAAGVVVISARSDDGFRGLTATSFSSLSLDPPQVMVAVDNLTVTHAAIVRTRAFNVSVLARSQEFLAERFAGRAPLVDPGWTEVPHLLGANGIPIVAGAIGWFECDLAALHPGGDHDVAIGAVTACGTAPGDPLILWERSFWGVS